LRQCLVSCVFFFHAHSTTKIAESSNLFGPDQ
jgi:hypothetical protein